MPDMKDLTPSERWNRDHPEAVAAARAKYAKKERARRKALTDYQRAHEDIARILDRLTPARRTQLLRKLLKRG